MMTSIFKEFYERELCDKWRCHTVGYLLQGVQKEYTMAVMAELMKDYFNKEKWNIQWDNKTQILTCINEEERKKHIYSIK